MTNARGVRPKRRDHAGGQGLRHQTHPLEHACPREVQIDVVLEDRVDHREPECRLRPDDPHTRQALQAHGHRIRDLILDLLRAVPRPVGEDDHLVVGQIRNGVNRRGLYRPPAPSGERDEEGGDDEPIAQREFDETVDHGRQTSRTRQRAQLGPSRRIGGGTHGYCRELRSGRRRAERASEPGRRGEARACATRRMMQAAQ